jgi:hypothetical protein
MLIAAWALLFVFAGMPRSDPAKRVEVFLR